jgi:NTP pyrophosphatase (non-canonical NTP hydrolase)
MTEPTDEQLTGWEQDVRAELREARRKFPDPNFLLAAHMEEVGELAQALLDHRLNPCLGTAVHARDEAIQVACVAQRIACEGDPSLSWPGLPYVERDA